MPAPHPADSQGAVRAFVGEQVKRAKDTAVEDKLPLRELNGPECQGLYFSRTSHVASPIDFKYWDEGAVAVDRLMVAFAVRANAADAPERAQALDVVRSLRFLPPGPPWRTPTGSYALPGPGWRIALDLPGYDIGPVEMLQPEGLKLGGTNPETKMIITVFLEEAQRGWTARDYREDYWRRIRKGQRADREDVVRSERGEMAIIEYRIPTMEGVAVNIKNFNAFLVRDGIWIDVHVSKEGFRPEDQALFDQVLASIRFEQ